MTQSIGASCDLEKTFEFDLTNIGLETFNSIKFNAEVAGVAQEFEWTGELPSGEMTHISFSMDVPFGSHTGTLSVIEVNGEPYQKTTSFAAESLEWAISEVTGETTDIKVYIIQDQFGEQITWDIINSAGDVVAQGGPYQHLIGSGSTQVNLENVTIPTNDCYLFNIYDSFGNGICCNYGNGSYYIKDANGDRIVDGDGAFGEQASHLFSVVNPVNVQLTTLEPQIPGYNMAEFKGTIVGDAEKVGFKYKKVAESTWEEVEGVLNDETFVAVVEGLETGTNYVVKAFALVGGQTVYGETIEFHTWYEGVSELEQSLKVYPNPANESLMVEGVMTQVEVYNTVGQCLLSRVVNEATTRINTSSFNNGIYFLRVSNNGETVVRKFTVNR
jgi:hypothetical protein